MYTITILMYLTLITMVGAYYMQKAAFRYLTRYVDSTPTPVTTMNESFGGADLDHWNYSYALGMDWTMFPALKDLMETYTSPWEDEDYAQQLNDSINAYEAEMDREWELEVQGYMFCDIATMMVLSSEDDPYEDLPFTASMRRSAKVGKSGINYALNCGAERSIHNAGDKVRK